MSLVPLSPIAAALAHVEPLLEKSRVLLIGNALTRASDMVLGRGARLCHVADPDARRVAQAAGQNSERRVTYSHFTDTLVRDGAYDVAIVTNLEEHDRPQEILDAARRAIASDGIVVVSAAASGATSGLLGKAERWLPYEELERLTKTTFQSVAFLAQTPFVGFAVVSLSLTSAPVPSLDNALLGGESDQVDYYIALCGAAETLATLDLDDMTVVQMPGQLALEVGRQAEVTRGARAERRLASLEDELRLAQRRERELEAELGRLESAAQDQAELNSLRETVERLTRELDTTRTELGEARAASLAATAYEELSEKAAHTERELERTKKERKWADDRVRRLERELEEALLAQEELDKARARIQTLETHLKESEDEVDELTDRVADLEQELAKKESALAERTEPDSALEKENLALEGQLKERGEHILALEKQLADLSLYAQTLAVENQRRVESSAIAPDSLKEELLSLSGELADKEAELVALRWTIASLEKRLGPSS